MDGPVRPYATGSIDVMIHNQTIFLLDHGDNYGHSSGFYRASISSLTLTGGWEELKNIPYKLSNLILFGDCLVTATQRPCCVLAYFPDSNRWIQLCDLSGEMYYSPYYAPPPSIIGLSCGTVLLMGNMFPNDMRVMDSSFHGFPHFSVLQVTPKSKLDLL